MNVYLDGEPENHIPELALRAEAVLADRWNGWLRPLATANALASFLEAWRQNDPNGTWGTVEEDGTALLCYRNDEEEAVDRFPLAGVSDQGEMLYDLTGWVWIQND